MPMISQFSPKAPTKRSRCTTPLNRKLERKLLGYVAAGVGLATAAAPAEAQIIYTPSNIPMAHSLYGAAGVTQLDLNNDGVADFSFANFIYAASSRSFDDLSVSGKQAGNSVVGVLLKGQSNITAAVLPRGVEVGPSNSFIRGANMVGIFGSHYGHFASGGWLPVESGYLGLKFVISGEVHYGWALVKFPYPYGFNSGSIYGYAYESTPNQPIVTGRVKDDDQPLSRTNAAVQSEFTKPSLGMLATGALGLPYWRATANSTGSPR